jgi:hypothetical protein
MTIPLVADEPQWTEDVELLHIIAQHSYHDRAWIVGNRLGLERLRDAIVAALDAPETRQEAAVFCADGEGYGVLVRCEPARLMHLVPYGYTHEWAHHDAPRPSWMGGY